MLCALFWPEFKEGLSEAEERATLFYTQGRSMVRKASKWLRFCFPVCCNMAKQWDGGDTELGFLPSDLKTPTLWAFKSCFPLQWCVFSAVKAVQLNLRDTCWKSSLLCPNDCQVKSEESSLENSLVENIADGKS